MSPHTDAGALLKRTPEQSFDGLILEADWANMHGGGCHDDNCEVCRDIANVRAAIRQAASQGREGGEREQIARIIDEHSVATVKLHGRQNASAHAVRMSDNAFAKADAVLALNKLTAVGENERYRVDDPWCRPGAAQASGDRGDLTKIAAECHRAKWEFDYSEERRPNAALARDLVIKAFNALHRIGDMALKLRDASSVPSATRGSGAAMIDNMTPEQLANWTDDGDCNAGTVALPSTPSKTGV